jgi:hypothetical protein
MDYFNLFSELAEARSASYKSGGLKKFAKGARNEEFPVPTPVPPVYDIRAHTNPVEMMYGSVYTPFDKAQEQLKKEYVFPRNMAPVIPSTGNLNLRKAPQVGKPNEVRDMQGNIIQPTLPVIEKGGMIKRADGSYSRRGLWDNIRANRGSGKKPTKEMLKQEKKIKGKYEEGGPIRPKPRPLSRPLSSPIYTSNPNDPRIQSYNDSLSAYTQYIKNRDAYEMAFPTFRTLEQMNAAQSRLNNNVNPSLINIQRVHCPYCLDFNSHIDMPLVINREIIPPTPIIFKPNNSSSSLKKSEVPKDEYISGGKSSATAPVLSVEKPKPSVMVRDEPKKYYLPRNQAPRLPNGKMNPQVLRGEGTSGIKVDRYGEPIEPVLRMESGGIKKINPPKKNRRVVSFPSTETEFINTYGNMVQLPENFNTLLGYYTSNKKPSKLEIYEQDCVASGTCGPNTKTFINPIFSTVVSNPPITTSNPPITTSNPPFVPNPEIIAKQKQLKETGLYSGKLDGIWGPKSEAAWAEYNKPKPVESKPTTVASRPQLTSEKEEPILVLPRNMAPVNPRTGRLNLQKVTPQEAGNRQRYDASGTPIMAKGGYTVRKTNERKGKTHVVTAPDGTKKYFGDPSMGERSKSKYGKDAFYKRHAKSLKKNPYFRAYAKATWEDGGIIRDVEPFNLSSY